MRVAAGRSRRAARRPRSIRPRRRGRATTSACRRPRGAGARRRPSARASRLAVPEVGALDLHDDPADDAAAREAAERELRRARVPGDVLALALRRRRAPSGRPRRRGRCARRRSPAGRATTWPGADGDLLGDVAVEVVEHERRRRRRATTNSSSSALWVCGGALTARARSSRGASRSPRARARRRGCDRRAELAAVALGRRARRRPRRSPPAAAAARRRARPGGGLAARTSPPRRRGRSIAGRSARGRSAAGGRPRSGDARRTRARSGPRRRRAACARRRRRGAGARRPAPISYVDAVLPATARCRRRRR